VVKSGSRQRQVGDVDHAHAETGRADDRFFRRTAAIAAVLSVFLAAGNLLTMLFAVRFDLDAVSNPLLLLRSGAAGAKLWRWSMILDLFGYYLLIIPVILYLRGTLRAKSPYWVDLCAYCLLAYCLIGALGAAILAMSTPALIEGYANAVPRQREILESLASSYADTVYKAMWNVLAELFAATGWIGFGVLLRGEHRALGTMTLALGVACLVDSVGTMFQWQLLSVTALSIYLLLAPLWALCVGLRLLRAPLQIKTADSGRT
jgi:hypothetical protein